MLSRFYCSSQLYNPLRYTLTISKVNVSKSINLRSVLANGLSKFARNASGSTKTRFSLRNLSKISLTLSGGLFCKYLLNNSLVLCKAQTRLAGFQQYEGKQQQFDWKLLWHYIKPHLWYFLAAIAGALIVAILNIQIPQIMGGLINVIAKFTELKNSEVFIKEMKHPAYKLIGMYLVQSFFTFFYIFMLSKIGEGIAFNMKKDLFASIIRQDIEFFDRQRTGEIITRLTTDVQDFKSSFKQTVSGGLRATTQIIGCGISLMLISPQMTFITMLCVPTIIAVGSTLGALLRQTSKKAQDQNEKTTAVADEAISNIRTVRAFAMEQLEMDLYEAEAEIATELNQKLGFGIGIFQAGTNLFLNSVVLGTLYLGGYLLSTDQLSAGQLMAYLMATQTIQRSLAQISLLFGATIRGMAAGSRVFEFINLQAKVDLNGGLILPLDAIRGAIKYENVDFAYPSRPAYNVLKRFNLDIPAGKTVALVGGSGNGKSTVIALLERFYDVKDGAIYIDGYDIRTLDPSWMRQNIFGLISQEPILFGTTVMENIRYGKPDANDDEVMEAAKLANAHDFISGFPKGYETMVGERGAALSGGQKQRIAIARALLKKPKILILDEATSALDSESEKMIHLALEEAKVDKTVIIISHRLSTVQNADIIVVLSNGNIVEMGTHEVLKKLGGYYCSLTYEQDKEAYAA